MRIGFDLDDTLSDNSGYMQAFWQNYIAQNNLPFKLVKKDTGNLAEMFDWSKEVFLESWEKAGLDYLTGAPARKNAKVLLAQLQKEGHEVYVITQRFWGDPYEISKNWLDSNGIPYDKLVVKAKDKLAACKEHNVNIYLDDKISAVDNLNQNGVKSIVMNTFFNKMEPTNSPRIDKIDEYYEIIKSMEIAEEEPTK